MYIYLGIYWYLNSENQLFLLQTVYCAIMCLVTLPLIILQSLADYHSIWWSRRNWLFGKRKTDVVIYDEQQLEKIFVLCWKSLAICSTQTCTLLEIKGNVSFLRYWFHLNFSFPPSAILIIIFDLLTDFSPLFVVCCLFFLVYMSTPSLYILLKTFVYVELYYHLLKTWSDTFINVLRTCKNHGLYSETESN